MSSLLRESPAADGAAAALLVSGGSPSSDKFGSGVTAAEADARVEPPQTPRALTTDAPHHFVYPALCVYCGGERPELAVMHGDPFCKTRCVRAWYGCPLDPATERPDQRAA